MKANLAIFFVLASELAANAVTISAVPIGNRVNVPDTRFSTSGFGAVNNNYRIGQYEVTNSEYTDFLNGVDPFGANTLTLYDPSMSNDTHGGILFNSSAPTGAKYVPKIGLEANPVVFVSWYDSLRFANWLYNGQGKGDTENGAYLLLGGTPIPTNASSITRVTSGRWFLPNESEWYKAAYYNPSAKAYFDYPTGNNVAPTASVPPATNNSANFAGIVSDTTRVGAYTATRSWYGTSDQGGNVSEWTDTRNTLGAPIVRGGSYANDLSYLHASGRDSANPAVGTADRGFRVATSIPAGLLDIPGRDSFDREMGTVISGNRQLNYEFFRPPGYGTADDLPLVVYLHGYGDGRSDQQSRLNTTMKGLVDTTQISGEQSAFLLVPKIPVLASWSNYIDMVRNLMSDLSSRYDTDSDRYYLIGYSDGGYNMQTMIADYPGLFAAGTPISGGGNPTSVMVQKLKSTPLWYFHGLDDFPSSTQAMVDALAAAGGNVRLTLIPGGHNAGYEYAFADPNHEFYPWLFSQTLAVPEPSTMLLFAVAGTTLSTCRRKPISHRRA